MQIGVFAKTFAGTDPMRVLAAAGNAGFSTVQYNMTCSGLDALPDLIEMDRATAVADAARDAQVSVSAVSGTYNMIHPDPTVRADGIRRLGVLAQASSAMGTKLVTLCTGTRDAANQWRHHPDNDTAEAWRDLLNAVGTAVELAETHDVLLGVEPELANVVSSARLARRLLNEIDSDRVRIVLDPANLFERATDTERRTLVEEAVDLLAGSIVMGHAKDRFPSGDFAPAGQGVIDFDHFLRVLDTSGFGGPVVAHGLSEREAPEVAAFLRLRLQALDK